MTLRSKMTGALLAGVAVLGAGCADSTQPALEINGVEFSRSELVDTIDLVDSTSGEASVLPSRARDLALEILIQRELISADLEAAGVPISETAQAAAVGQAEANIAGGQLAEKARAFAEEFVALRTTFIEHYGNDAEGQLLDLILSADIEIDPRFGSWVDGVGLVPAGST